MTKLPAKTNKLPLQEFIIKSHIEPADIEMIKAKNLVAYSEDMTQKIRDAITKYQKGLHFLKSEDIGMYIAFGPRDIDEEFMQEKYQEIKEHTRAKVREVAEFLDSLVDLEELHGRLFENVPYPFGDTEK